MHAKSHNHYYETDTFVFSLPHFKHLTDCHVLQNTDV